MIKPDSRHNRTLLKCLDYITEQYRSTGEQPSLRDIARFMGYKSPRSAQVIVKELVEKGYVKKDSSGAVLPLFITSEDKLEELLEKVSETKRLAIELDQTIEYDGTREELELGFLDHAIRSLEDAQLDFSHVKKVLSKKLSIN